MATIDVKDAAGVTRTLQAPPGNGQATMANSRPVTIASDQSAVPVAAAALPLPAGAATAARQDTGNTSLAAIATSVTGAATVARQDTGNTSLASIASSVGGVATGSRQDTGNTSLAAIATSVNGVASAAKQDTGNTSLAAIATSVNGVASAARQDTGNTSLATIATAVTGVATAARQDTGNTSLAAIASSVAGKLNAVASASFTRPADTTAYAVGDLVANSVTAGSVAPMSVALARVNGGTGVINRLRLATSKTGLALTETFRVKFYRTSPTSSVGDNGVFATTNGIAAGYIGYADVVLNQAQGDGTKGSVQPAAGAMTFQSGAATTNLFALIEARTAYTPASGEVFTLEVEVCRD